MEKHFETLYLIKIPIVRLIEQNGSSVHIPLLYSNLLAGMLGYDNMDGK